MPSISAAWDRVNLSDGEDPQVRALGGTGGRKQGAEDQKLSHGADTPWRKGGLQ